jgi:hypothetical protein
VVEAAVAGAGEPVAQVLAAGGIGRGGAGPGLEVVAAGEPGLVTANQQALTNAVSAYRAAYKKALTKLAAQLRTAKAQPFT